MVVCSFCGKTLARGTGVMYVKKDAKVFYFCSTKCEKNMNKLGRKPRNIGWTKAHADLKKSTDKK